MNQCGSASNLATIDDLESMRRSRTLTLFGLDGAGKTTLAKMTISRMKALGIDAVYARPKFGERLTKKAVTEELPCRANGRSRKWTSPSRLVEAIGLPYLLLEHFVASNIEIAEPLREGKCVVAERSWPDTLVDLVVDFRIPYDLAKALVKPAISRRNGCLIFLDVPCEVAICRKPGPYGIEYLSARESAYRTIVKEFRAHSISTIQSPQTTLDELMEILRTR